MIASEPALRTTAASVGVSDSCQITPTNHDQRRQSLAQEKACFRGSGHL
jgi:hypothetical protein